MARYQRRDSPDGHAHASMLELFYDLVFVFAITQVSHPLLEHLTWEGAGQSAVVLLVVWWSWNYTTWATNELDPDATVVRRAADRGDAGSLLMSIAIPEAFGERGAALRRSPTWRSRSAGTAFLPSPRPRGGRSSGPRARGS